MTIVETSAKWYLEDTHEQTLLQLYICDILITQVTCDINGKANFTNQACSFVL